ncbi:predicted protein [Brucella suis bv. 5 str. 513]|nr:predicted protein [Brucella suis bv. 5 str. 513]
MRSGAHVPLSTLRSGTRKSLFSPRPDEFATVVLTGLPKHSQRKRTSWRNGPCSGCFLNRKFAHELPVTFYHDFAHYGGASK